LAVRINPAVVFDVDIPAMTRTHAERRAADRLGLVDARRGLFTPEQAAQIEQWRAENNDAIAAEVAKMKGQGNE